MEDILHRVVIKATPEKIYEAVTTQQGIEAWWCKHTTAKPELGSVNVFVFGQDRSEMKVSELDPGKRVTWECIDSIEEWIGTRVSFDLEQKNEKTILRFTHGGWRAVTDMYAGCNYQWALFMKSLKSYCETGKGEPG